MLVIPNRLVRNVYNQKLCYDQLPVGLIRALPGYLRSQGSNPGKLEFWQPFFHNYIIYWSKHVSCTFSCDDLLCIYSKSLLLVCNPNHYFRCLTLTLPLTWHCDSFTHLAHKTSFLCIIVIFILPTFSHLFFRNERQNFTCIYILSWMLSLTLNPLSPNGDQDQFSPNKLHRLSRDKSWELIKWSPKRKGLDLTLNSLN